MPDQLTGTPQPRHAAHAARKREDNLQHDAVLRLPPEDKRLAIARRLGWDADTRAFRAGSIDEAEYQRRRDSWGVTWANNPERTHDPAGGDIHNQNLWSK